MIYIHTNNLGEIVRFHRKKKGLTQMGLANLAGVGKTMVFDLEKGKKTVKLETLLKVLDALDIRLEGHSSIMDMYEKSLPVEPVFKNESPETHEETWPAKENY